MTGRLFLLTMLWANLALATSDAQSASSKLPASKIATATCDDEGTHGGGIADELPASPDVHVGGERQESAISNTLEVDGRTIHLRPLHDELQLTYVHNLIAPAEIDELVQLATSRGGWGRSPLKAQRSGDSLSKDDRRNSSSCPMLWPLVYAGREDEIRRMAVDQAAALLDELHLVSNLSRRVAELFTATGMEITADFIEPMQLVRYQPTETFRPHHDYHEPAADGSLGSSVQGEQRAFTVLLFGSTLAPGSGGETAFPQLELTVAPKAGDALVWANVDADGAPNPRSLHEGRPPTAGEKVAVNVWVADKPFDVRGDMQQAVKT